MKKAVFGLVLFWLIPQVGYGATLYIDPARPILYRGDAITLAVRLMPDQNAGECINAIDATISYTANIIPVDVSIGKSIVPVWIQAPKIDTEKKQITFAGGIPNGYCGRIEGDPRLTNVIAEIIVRSPGLQIGGSNDINAEVKFEESTQVLLNDGFGTIAPLTKISSEITLEKTPGGALKDDWREVVQGDEIPPESFSIELVRDEEFIDFSGKYYIVFNTTDKQSGLSHYEVTEEPLKSLGNPSWGGTGVPWIKATSPYVLSDQSLNSIVYVKAIDKSGNEYVAKFVPDEAKRTLSNDTIITYVIWGSLAFLFLVMLLIAILFVRRTLKARRSKLITITDNSIVEKDKNNV